jgi:hypothetical protein|tara:strand:- start:2709 stop:3167 length:459 start_codon:yes stop_codon:yes gene_type:complete
MRKPEAILLQDALDPASATLANGVKCGNEFRRSMKAGWQEWISFTGELMETFLASEDPATEGMFNIQEHAGTRRMDIVGRRILGVSTNITTPEIMQVLIEGPEDPDNPGAIECRASLLRSDRRTDPHFHPSFIELLQALRKLPQGEELYKNA